MHLLISSFLLLFDLEPQPEDEKNAEVFKDLHLEKSERTIKPLFEGTWE